jgi:hypothetical protein
MGIPVVVIALFLKKYASFAIYKAAKEYGNVKNLDIICWKVIM